MCKNLLLLEVNLIMHILILLRSLLFFIGNLREYYYWKITLGLHLQNFCGAVPHHLPDRGTITYYWQMLHTSVLFCNCFLAVYSGSRYSAHCLWTKTFTLKESQAWFIWDFWGVKLFLLLGDCGTWNRDPSVSYWQNEGVGKGSSVVEMALSWLPFFSMSLACHLVFSEQAM